MAGMVAAFLVLAVVKPWSFGETGSSGATPTAPGSAAVPASSRAAIQAESTPAATIRGPDPNAMACMGDDTEQLVTIARWSGQEVRTWVATKDMTASGPLDRRLLPISVFSIHLIGVGICAPRVGADALPSEAGQPSLQGGPSARLLDVRSIAQTANGPVSVDLGVPDPITGQLSGPDLAVLYGPPTVVRPAVPGGPSGLQTPESRPIQAAPSPGIPAPTSLLGASVGATWPPGSYAIAFQFDSDGASVVRWLRLDITKGAGDLE